MLVIIISINFALISLVHVVIIKFLCFLYRLAVGLELRYDPSLDSVFLCAYNIFN